MYLVFENCLFTFGSDSPKCRQYPVHFWNKVESCHPFDVILYF